MGHAVIADRTSIRLAGERPVSKQTRKEVEQQTRSHLDLAKFQRETHVGYAKVTETGDVIVDFFTEFNEQSSQLP